MNSGPVFDLVMDATKQVQQLRAAVNTTKAGAALKTLKRNANLQRVAQRTANLLQSGAPGSGVPADTRSPLERAHDNDIGASDALKVLELVGSGATSVFEIIEAMHADTACKAALVDEDVGYIGVGVGGGEFGIMLVIVLGQRPMEGAPELPEMDEFESTFTAENLLSLPGRTVKVAVSA